jgi:hypothetical protein
MFYFASLEYIVTREREKKLSDSGDLHDVVTMSIPSNVFARRTLKTDLITDQDCIAESRSNFHRHCRWFKLFLLYCLTLYVLDYLKLQALTR